MHVRNEPSGSMNWAVMKSQMSMRLLPIIVRLFTAPQDNEQRTDMTQQASVTIHAALGRLVCSSSRKKAVPISCMEIVEVRAARTSNA